MSHLLKPTQPTERSYALTVDSSAGWFGVNRCDFEFTHIKFDIFIFLHILHQYIGLKRKINLVCIVGVVVFNET